LLFHHKIQVIDLKNPHPVIIIERAELLASGVTDVGDLLQRLPYFSGSPENTRTNVGGTGAVRIDLRGTGTDRTLVLIDARRTVDKGDFQSIPAAMIERVEILKEGASVVYGANIGTQAATYRVFGRTWFVRWNTRF